MIAVSTTRGRTGDGAVETMPGATAVGGGADGVEAEVGDVATGSDVWMTGIRGSGLAPSTCREGKYLTCSMCSACADRQCLFQV